MAPTIKHAFVSPKLDGPDPTIVRPTDWNAPHTLEGSGWFVPGMVIDYVGHTIPDGFLEAYGQSVAAAAYPNLFAAMVKQNIVTFTAGTPGVVNWLGHGLPVNSKVRFRNSGGALPAAITANVDYFILSTGYTADSFRISATLGGTEIAFATGGTGTHSGVNAQFGASADLTTFTVPDFRGRVAAGLDMMGGTSANRLTSASGVEGDLLGAVGGLETHTLTLAETVAHQHNNDPPNPTIDFSGLVVTIGSAGGHTHTDTFALSGSVAAGGGHTHAHTLDIGGSLGSEAAHTHNSGTLAGVTNNTGAHTHAVQQEVTGESAEGFPGGQGGGSKDIYQFGSEPNGDGRVLAASSAGAHAHTVDVNSGNTGAGSSHTHSITSLTVTGAITSVADHTHSIAGVSITGGIDAVLAHTHTATPSGTITSALADFMSASAGGGGAHNNVQPTIVVRKLIYGA